MKRSPKKSCRSGPGVRLTVCGSCRFLNGSGGLRISALVPDCWHLFMPMCNCTRGLLTHSLMPIPAASCRQEDNKGKKARRILPTELDKTNCFKCVKKCVRNIGPGPCDVFGRGQQSNGHWGRHSCITPHARIHVRFAPMEDRSLPPCCASAHGDTM